MVCICVLVFVLFPSSIAFALDENSPELIWEIGVNETPPDYTEPPAKAVLVIDDNKDVHFEDDQSVGIFQSAFEDIGYDVKIERSDETSNSTWSDYDIVVWSCGDDLIPMYYPDYREMLVDYVTDGGHLILESGQISAWNKRFGDQAIDYELRKKVLHATTDWVYSAVGNLTLRTQHPITTTPNALPDTIGFTPTNPGDDSGDADAVRILPTATGVYNWSYVHYMGKPIKESVAHISYGLIAYDNDADVTNGGQVIYYAFDIDDIDNPDIQRKLIENSAKWLREVVPPTPTLTSISFVGPTPTPTPISTPKPASTPISTATATLTNLPPVCLFRCSTKSPEVKELVEFDASDSCDHDGKIKVYLWDFGDGKAAEGIVVSHSYSTGGTCTVKLRVIDDGGAEGSTETIIVINHPPKSSCKFNPCMPKTNELIEFDASSSKDLDGYIKEYRWDFGDGETGREKIVYHNYSQAGSYTVKLTVTDDKGAKGLFNLTVSVEPPRINWEQFSAFLAIIVILSSIIVWLMKWNKRRIS
jgi:PKD repeat protein